MIRRGFLRAALLLGLAGCVSAPLSPAIQEARQQIRDGRAECVLIANGKLISERGHGVSPLLSLYESRPAEFAGAIVVDKVIGRAAAAIAICGKAKFVHGEVMSEDAVTFLNDNGIGVGYTLLVPRILNQKRNGLCPLEQSVEGITDPPRALAALRAKIASFGKR